MFAFLCLVLWTYGIVRQMTIYSINFIETPFTSISSSLFTTAFCIHSTMKHTHTQSSTQPNAKHKAAIYYYLLKTQTASAPRSDAPSARRTWATCSRMDRRRRANATASTRLPSSFCPPTSWTAKISNWWTQSALRWEKAALKLDVFVYKSSYDRRSNK